jgi:hypothetical protein
VAGHLAATLIDTVEEIAAVDTMIVVLADMIVVMTVEDMIVDTIVGMIAGMTAGPRLQEVMTGETVVMIAGTEALTVVMTVGKIDTGGKFVFVV